MSLVCLRKVSNAANFVTVLHGVIHIVRTHEWGEASTEKRMARKCRPLGQKLGPIFLIFFNVFSFLKKQTISVMVAWQRK